MPKPDVIASIGVLLEYKTQKHISLTQSIKDDLSVVVPYPYDVPSWETRIIYSIFPSDD